MTSLEKSKAPSISIAVPLERTIMFVLTPILRLFDPLVQTATGIVSSQRTQRVVIRSAFSVIAAISIVSVAVWSYLVFYWIYVPELSIQNPVWFQYGTTHVASALVSSPPVLPYAKVDLTSGGRHSQPLHYDQVYSVLLDLHVPASERNVDLGNFMVSLWLKNSANKTVHYSARPAILRYRSSLLHTMLTFYRSLPLLLGFSDESQRIKVNLIENFVGDYRNPITTAELTLSTPNLQLYSAQLVLDAHLSGFRYLMYYWPISTAISFISMFLFWEIIFAVTTWRYIARVYPEQVDAVSRIMSDVDGTDFATENEERTDEGEETEVPGGGDEGDEDDEEVPPTPTTTTMSGVEGKDGFETETETEASMSMYGDEYETETEAEGFQEVPGRF